MNKIKENIDRGIVAGIKKAGREMTYQEADARLQELAGEHTWALRYETASYLRAGYRISAYISSCGFVDGLTYGQVITGIEAKLGIGYQEPPEIGDEYTEKDRQIDNEIEKALEESGH